MIEVIYDKKKTFILGFFLNKYLVKLLNWKNNQNILLLTNVCQCQKHSCQLWQMEINYLACRNFAYHLGWKKTALSSIMYTRIRFAIKNTAIQNEPAWNNRKSILNIIVCFLS